MMTSGRNSLKAAEHGYAMAALLVAMNIMAIMMMVAMPVWRQLAQREKEEELIFRGQQYARAVGLYERKFANAPPPSIDALVQQHFLRKKYKDPITNEDFVPITAVQAVSATAQSTTGPAGRVGLAQQPATAGRSGSAPSTGVQGGGGVIGVTSKSRAQSIRIYNGRSRYNEWTFVYAPPAPTPGAGGGPGAATPGQRGQPQRGQQGGPGGPIPGGRGGADGRGGPDGRGGSGRGGPGGQQGPGRGQGPAGGGFVNPFQTPQRGR